MKYRLESAFSFKAGIFPHSEMETESVSQRLPRLRNSPDSLVFSQDAYFREHCSPDKPHRLSPAIDRGGASERRIVFGLGRIDNQLAREFVSTALKVGYRHLDTASVYGNEEGLGLAVKEAGDILGLGREDIHIGIKLPNDSHGYDATLRACDLSLARLGLEWIDLFLIHWPLPDQGLYPEAWKAMLRLRREGRVRAVGVANFLPGQVDRLIAETGEQPAVNQLEINPYRQGYELCLAMDQRTVPVEARSPFGGISLSDPLFRKLAVKHGRTPAQIILRWHLECGRGGYSQNHQPAHENLKVFDFRLDVEDMRQITLLDRGGAFDSKASYQ